jgi:hypothetical protein
MHVRIRRKGLEWSILRFADRKFWHSLSGGKCVTLTHRSNNAVWIEFGLGKIASFVYGFHDVQTCYLGAAQKD